jgi:hypothetical protein
MMMDLQECSSMFNHHHHHHLDTDTPNLFAKSIDQSVATNINESDYLITQNSPSNGPEAANPSVANTQNQCQQFSDLSDYLSYKRSSVAQTNYDLDYSSLYFEAIDLCLPTAQNSTNLIAPSLIPPQSFVSSYASSNTSCSYSSKSSTSNNYAGSNGFTGFGNSNKQRCNSEPISKFFYDDDEEQEDPAIQTQNLQNCEASNVYQEAQELVEPAKNSFLDENNIDNSNVSIDMDETFFIFRQ